MDICSEVSMKGLLIAVILLMETMVTSSQLSRRVNEKISTVKWTASKPTTQKAKAPSTTTPPLPFSWPNSVFMDMPMVWAFRPPVGRTISMNISFVNDVNGTSNRLNASSANGSGTTTVNALCGYPPYNDRNACDSKHLNDFIKDPLSKCEVDGGAVVFSFVIGLLGVCIIFVNALLPVVAWKTSNMRTQYDYIKVSLAASDVIMGFLLLASVLPNVSRLRNLTAPEAYQYVEDDTNSATAVIVGSLLTVSIQASILHLMFLSIERFSAIKWSFWHIKRKTSSIALTLAAIWIVSFVSSFIPAAFPRYFEYRLQPAVLIHMMSLKKVSDSNGTLYLGYQGPLYESISFLLLYVVTVLFSILTSIVVHNKLNSGVSKFNKQHGESAFQTEPELLHLATDTLLRRRKTKKGVSKSMLRPEISVFVTIVIMIAAFTITLLPLSVASLLFVAGVLQCSNYTFPYVFAFYIGMLNTLMNPLIYTVRNQKFRAALRNVFRSRKIVSKNSSAVHSGSNTTQMQKLHSTSV